LLDQRLIGLDREISDLDRVLRNLNPHFNNLAKDSFDQMKANREQLDQERNADIEDLRLLRFNLPDAQRSIREIDAKFQSLRQECESTAGEVRELINSMDAKYADLAKNRDAQAGFRQYLFGSSFGVRTCKSTKAAWH